MATIQSINPKMQALVLVKRRSRNILRHETVNTPSPKKEEVLVKVTYCGFNQFRPGCNY